VTNAGSSPTIIAGPPKSMAGDEGRLIERHLDTTNILFCDGHVKSVKVDFLNQRSASNANFMKYFTITDD
jgi:prepilin-type processing-associated H-X9-DG protein